MAAARLDEDKLNNAQVTLMDLKSDVWMDAVRAATSAKIEAMTGDWNAPFATFHYNLHFPRQPGR